MRCHRQPGRGGVTCGQPARGKPQGGAKDGVSGDCHEDEASRNRDVERSWIGGKEHPQLNGECEQYGPCPVPPSAVPNNRQVHHAEGRAVAEVINPTDDVRGGRVFRLLDGFAQDHRSESWENLEQIQRRDHGVDTPFLGEYKRKPEHVVRDRRQQAAHEPYPDRAPELAVASKPIQDRERKEEDQRWQEDERRKEAHRAETVEIRQQAGEGRSRQEENNPSPSCVPIIHTRWFSWSPVHACPVFYWIPVNRPSIPWGPSQTWQGASLRGAFLEPHAMHF